MLAMFLIVVVILGFQMLLAFLRWWDSVSPGTPQKVWYTLGIVGLIIVILEKVLGIEG